MLWVEKFAGVGLKNIFLIWLVCMVFSLMAKVIVAKYPIDGLTQIVMVGS